jgi:hypothetical protein
MLSELGVPELAAQEKRNARETSERWARGEAVTQNGYQYGAATGAASGPGPQVEQNIAGVTIVVQQMPTPAQFRELMTQYAAQGV